MLCSDAYVTIHMSNKDAEQTFDENQCDIHSMLWCSCAFCCWEEKKKHHGTISFSSDFFPFTTVVNYKIEAKLDIWEYRLLFIATIHARNVYTPDAKCTHSHKFVKYCSMSTVISALGVNIAHTSPPKMIRFGFWITLWFDWNVIGLIPIIHMCVHVGIVVDHNQIILDWVTLPFIQ